MKGYGWSIWLLPTMKFRTKFIDIMKNKNVNIIHSPHITVRTNFNKKKDAELFFKENNFNTEQKYNFNIFGKLYRSANQYPQDPLGAYIFKASVPDIKFNHTPHMSALYFPKNKTKIEEPENIYINMKGEGMLKIVNTKSLNPSKWK